MSREFFVASTDIPAEFAEEVAAHAHRRGCGEFNGQKTSAPPFKERHKDADVVWASIHVADICNVLQVTPEALLSLRKGATP